jgi:hypothetical protein
VNSHADGTHSIPFYEGVLSSVVHLTKRVAVAEHRPLAVKAGAAATAGGLSLRAWRGTSFCAKRGWATLRAGNRPSIRADPKSTPGYCLRLQSLLDSLPVSTPVRLEGGNLKLTRLDQTQWSITYGEVSVGGIDRG